MILKRRLKLTWVSLTELLSGEELLIEETKLETAEQIENVTLVTPHKIVIDLIRHTKRKEI